MFFPSNKVSLLPLCQFSLYHKQHDTGLWWNWKKFSNKNNCHHCHKWVYEGCPQICGFCPEIWSLLECENSWTYLGKKTTCQGTLWVWVYCLDDWRHTWNWSLKFSRCTSVGDWNLCCTVMGFNIVLMFLWMMSKVMPCRSYDPLSPTIACLFNLNSNFRHIFHVILNIFTAVGMHFDVLNLH